MGIFSKSIRIAKYVRNYADTVKRSPAYIRVYKNIANKLEQFERESKQTLKNDNFGYKDFCAFIDFLNRQGLKQNTVRSLADKLKFILSLMIRDMYKVNSTAFQVRIKSEFVTSVYLSVDEVKQLYYYKHYDKAQRIVVDLFAVGCFTGMRYSDYSTLNSNNIQCGFIVKKTKKTGVVVKIPIHPIVREILERYDGFPKYKGSKQNFNKVLKTAVRRNGFNQEILCEFTQGGKIVRQVKRKYEMIASHTARRSFATNAYLAGIPIARIMMLTGHQSETSFFKYIKIQNTENAEELAHHAFFAIA
ncbi:MAG: tyrosine-type recombinase/integrase [Bacteroidales bacterium]|nr:tyrosine-type recombinase/integrase [Bacteroidales bacterium]